ncbi:hypothetical protein HDU76_006203, partial [Blyttiomyces sp. JEL0837]
MKPSISTRGIKMSKKRRHPISRRPKNTQVIKPVVTTPSKRIYSSSTEDRDDDPASGKLDGKDSRCTGDDYGAGDRGVGKDNPKQRENIVPLQDGPHGNRGSLMNRDKSDDVGGSEVGKDCGSIINEGKEGGCRADVDYSERDGGEILEETLKRENFQRVKELTNSSDISEPMDDQLKP